jgi:hypothetical protein
MRLLTSAVDVTSRGRLIATKLATHKKISYLDIQM